MQVYAWGSTLVASEPAWPAHLRALTHTRTQTHTYTYTYTHDAREHTLTPHKHTHTHTHKHTHTRARKYTHTQHLFVRSEEASFHSTFAVKRHRCTWYASAYALLRSSFHSTFITSLSLPSASTCCKLGTNQK
jgi:hypothetical protein